MSDAATHESHLRVNLRFGTRTDRALLRELSTYTPYARARFIRTLILEGWRLRLAGGRVLPASTPEPQSIPQEFEEVLFSDEVAALLGKTIRL
jgi:hypothetical protein